MRFLPVVVAFTLSLSALAEDRKESEPFKLIHVDDLIKLQTGAKPVQVYDCNGPGTREKEGIIPGAHLLASSSDYDTAKELPADKSATLVFYCHNKW